MKIKNSPKKYVLSLYLSEDAFNDKIARLERGVQVAEGTLYCERGEDFLRFFINRPSRNAFSPVFRCTVSFSKEEREKVLEGSFFFRKFTINYIFFLIFATVAGVFLLIKSFLQGQFNGDMANLGWVVLPILLLLSLLLSLGRGRHLFEADQALILNEVKNFFYRG